jgi:hypothetical protein
VNDAYVPYDLPSGSRPGAPAGAGVEAAVEAAGASWKDSVTSTPRDERLACDVDVVDGQHHIVERSRLVGRDARAEEHGCVRARRGQVHRAVAAVAIAGGVLLLIGGSAASIDARTIAARGRYTEDA